MFYIVSGGGDSTRIPFWIHFDGLTSAGKPMVSHLCGPWPRGYEKRTENTTCLSLPKPPNKKKAFRTLWTQYHSQTSNNINTLAFFEVCEPKSLHTFQTKLYNFPDIRIFDDT